MKRLIIIWIVLAASLLLAGGLYEKITVDQGSVPEVVYEVPHYEAPYANYCVKCDKQACYIYHGNSLCEKCFKKQKGGE